MVHIDVAAAKSVIAALQKFIEEAEADSLTEPVEWTGIEDKS